MHVGADLRSWAVADVWASRHVDNGNKLRSSCLPFDYVACEDGTVQYGRPMDDLVQLWLCYPALGVRMRLYACRVAVFNSAEEVHCASRPSAVVEGAKRAAVVCIAQKKYFKNVKDVGGLVAFRV